MVKGGFIYQASTYRSLSEIARTITGTRWNGWTFFGLKKTGGATAAPAERKSGRRVAPARAPSVGQQPSAGEVLHA